MGKIFYMEFKIHPLKFHTKYLTHPLKDPYFIEIWKSKSSEIEELVSIFEMVPRPPVRL